MCRHATVSPSVNGDTLLDLENREARGELYGKNHTRSSLMSPLYRWCKRRRTCLSEALSVHVSDESFYILTNASWPSNAQRRVTGSDPRNENRFK